ncbi:MAG TPA: methyltransferase domain-containing protein [Candidatus Krumholzibacteria bacterium]|nr:methyltransferase domain-containing protein [Candidatus Krumholzibacteria bacterium]
MNDLELLEKYFDRVAEGFDAIYSGKKPLPSRVWDRLTRRSLHERLDYCLAVLSPLKGRSVLDVGCGSGRGSVAFAERGANVVGIDVSGRMLEMARELASERRVADHCTFERVDVIGMGRERSFDHAVATGFWDYVIDAQPVMDALGAIVRDGLVASFPARDAFRAPFRTLWLRARHCPVRFFSEADITALCERAGFEVKELRHSGPMFLLHAQRRR